MSMSSGGKYCATEIKVFMEMTVIGKTKLKVSEICFGLLCICPCQTKTEVEYQ